MDLSTRVKTVFEPMMMSDPEREENNKGSQPAAKSCRAVTLSCWLAFLTFIIVFTQSILSWLKDLTTKDEFWDNAERFFRYLHANNQTVQTWMKNITEGQIQKSL